MPPSPQDNKNSLQSVVDGIQTLAKDESQNKQGKGYVPNPELKSLRTFQGDMQDHIEKGKETISTIALAEQKKKIEKNEPTYTERPVGSSHAGLFIVIGMICLIGGGVIFGAIYFFKTKNETTIKTVVEKTLIPYTTKKENILGNQNIENIASILLQEQSDLNAEINTIVYNTYTYNGDILPSNSLANILFGRSGDALKRNILEIMTGVYSYDTNEIFFILQPDNFGIVYTGMLEWESTMGEDMSPFFPRLQEYLKSNPSVFTDETYKNKDVRVIRNSSGDIVLLYGFIDKDTLVITSNEKIFQAILNKYLQSKLSR
ncbi:MAG: hypothetical protein ACYCZW_01895 [Minisyncoccota bacterium]